MQAEQSLQQGQPEAALAQLQEQIKKDPANAKLRVFLFQLLAVLGQWSRALKQLQVAGELDPANLLMVQTYREAIQCEVLRAEIFVGKRTPLVFGDPQPWLAPLLEALRLEAGGHYAESQALREQAFDAAPASSGRIDDSAFQWLADADGRLGPVLEAIVNGRYYWIPLLQIRKIEFEPPADLRDVVWMPAVFTWINGGQASGLIPTRYPDSEHSEDPLIRLARKTEWLECAPGVYHGLGQRLLASEAADFALMDVRRIEFDHPA